jgi:hypothetical protein
MLLPTFSEAVNLVRHPERMKALGIPPKLALARIRVQAGVLPSHLPGPTAAPGPTETGPRNPHQQTTRPGGWPRE